MQFGTFDTKQGFPVQIAFLLSCLLMAAFFVSPALMSIAMSGILLVGIFSYRSFTAIIKADVVLKRLSLLFVVLLLFHIAAWLLSDNMQEGQRKFFLKLPFLLSPVLWVVFARFSQTQRNLILFCYIFFVYLAGTISTLVYFMNQAYFDALIRSAKPIPIFFGYGVYHIQFSVLNAIACLSGLYLLISLKSNLQKPVYYAVLIFTVINIANLHILSARTGLLGFYAGLFVSALVYMKNQGKMKYLKFLPLLLLLPVGVYFLSNSLQNRMADSMEDLDTIIHSKDANDKSVAMRVEAWKNGIALLAEHPFTGIGLGDVDAEMQRKYVERHTTLIEQNRKNPHNQFLETSLHTGVFGAIVLFLIFVLYAWVQRKNYAGLWVVVILFVSVFFESLLERQVSIMAMSFFIGFWIFNEEDTELNLSK